MFIRQVPLGRSLKENSSARAKSLGSHSKSDDGDVARRRAAPKVEAQMAKTGTDSITTLNFTVVDKRANRSKLRGIPNS